MGWKDPELADQSGAALVTTRSSWCVLHRCVACTPRFLPFPKRYRPGGPRSPPASRRAQTPTTAAALEFWRSLLLDHSPPPMVPLGRCPPHCQTGHPRWLASRRLSALLALAVSSVRRAAEDHPGTEGFDRTPGEGESRLGLPQNPRGTREAWIQYRRTERCPVSAPHDSPG